MADSKTSTWAVCSGCGKKYLVPVIMLGRWARCKECGVKFRLERFEGSGKKQGDDDNQAV